MIERTLTKEVIKRRRVGINLLPSQKLSIFFTRSRNPASSSADGLAAPGQAIARKPVQFILYRPQILATEIVRKSHNPDLPTPKTDVNSMGQTGTMALKPGR